MKQIFKRWEYVYVVGSVWHDTLPTVRPEIICALRKRDRKYKVASLNYFCIDEKNIFRSKEEAERHVLTCSTEYVNYH